MHYFAIAVLLFAAPLLRQAKPRFSLPQHIETMPLRVCSKQGLCIPMRNNASASLCVTTPVPIVSVHCLGRSLLRRCSTTLFHCYRCNSQPLQSSVSRGLTKPQLFRAVQCHFSAPPRFALASLVASMLILRNTTHAFPLRRPAKQCLRFASLGNSSAKNFVCKAALA